MTDDGPEPGELISLRATSAAHHALLMPHVDRLLTLAEMVGRVECAAPHAFYNEEYGFVAAQLIPHIDTVEAVLYERLEGLMATRHTMAPMREEHETVRQLVAELGTYQVHKDHCTWNEMEGLALRRAPTGSTRCSRCTWPRRSSISPSWTAASRTPRRTCWRGAWSTRRQRAGRVHGPLSRSRWSWRPGSGVGPTGTCCARSSSGATSAPSPGASWPGWRDAFPVASRSTPRDPPRAHRRQA